MSFAVLKSRFAGFGRWWFENEKDQIEEAKVVKYHKGSNQEKNHEATKRDSVLLDNSLQDAPFVMKVFLFLVGMAVVGNGAIVGGIVGGIIGGNIGNIGNFTFRPSGDTIGGPLGFILGSIGGALLCGGLIESKRLRKKCCGLLWWTHTAIAPGRSESAMNEHKHDIFPSSKRNEMSFLLNLVSWGILMQAALINWTDVLASLTTLFVVPNIALVLWMALVGLGLAAFEWKKSRRELKRPSRKLIFSAISNLILVFVLVMLILYGSSLLRPFLRGVM